jgi:hypothetical protein
MRSQSGWSDACILNVSSRGLLVYSQGAAELGSFVEVRRGGQLVVARVVWRNNQRIGLCSLDPIHVEDIVSAAAGPVAVTVSKPITVERRVVPRDAERSRIHGRAIEFVAVVAIASAMAGAGALSLRDALAVPLTSVNRALGGH